MNAIHEYDITISSALSATRPLRNNPLESFKNIFVLININNTDRMQIHKIPWAPTSGRLNLLPCPPFFFIVSFVFYRRQTSICEYTGIFSLPKPLRAENDFHTGCVSWIYRIFLSRYFDNYRTIEQETILLPVEFSIFRTRLVSSSIQLSHTLRFRWSAWRLLRLTCTDRTRSLPSACDSRICRNSATLPYTRSSRNSSNHSGSAPVPSMPCTLDRFCNENS